MNLRFNQLMHDNVAEASLLLGRSPARSDATSAAQLLQKRLRPITGNRELLANGSV